MNSKRLPACICALPVLMAMATGARADQSKPSRPPVDKCTWERLADRDVGLAAWVQRCDFGFRQIHFELGGNALAIKYSDGGPADPVVEVFDMLPGEAADAVLGRIFSQKTEKAISTRCVLMPYTEGAAPAGTMRYVFSPDAAYREELKAVADPDEVGEPPCGEWGEAPDGIQYFEVQSPELRKLLFVRVGQEEPLFDEQTLQILPPG
ncbi:hypothetical protein [Mesorhizobium sp. M0060]|uniref:hypothetical protein n=1 Tax=Mesorhizobium sp. M0060 TaxID=2956866 RepID=UPI00333D3759